MTTFTTISLLLIIMIGGGIFYLFFIHNRRSRTTRPLPQTKPEERDVMYRNLVQTANSMIVQWRQDGTITFFNDYAQSFFGYSENEILGMNINLLLSKKETPASDVVREIVSKPEGFVINISENIRKDGRVAWVMWTNKPEYNDKKELVAILSVGSDITELKQAAVLIEASEIRYRRLFETAQDGILILDAQTGKIIDVNPFMIYLLGFSYDQFLGKTIWDIGFFRDLIPNKDKFLELQSQKYLRYEDLPLETADGKRIDVEFVSSVYEIAGKKIIQCNIRNITEHRQAEALIEASELKYRRLFEASQDGILILDAQTGMIENVNPLMISLLGFSFDQFLGKTIWDIGFFSDIIPNKDKFQELQEKKFVRYDTLPLETADGKKIDVEFVSSVYEISQKKIIQCNIRDVTEKQKAKNDRLRLIAELERSNTDLQQFANVASHDLQEPLRMITSYLSFLNEDTVMHWMRMHMTLLISP